ncbi:SMI1/KNR4 family protein [Kribbella sp. NPDC050124]|uniref:SMI1/KNR4 family protein n=1 Tax=Kribbella sp. NPDC050124 TaxID=3364114 RepID=UPI0037ADE990
MKAPNVLAAIARTVAEDGPEGWQQATLTATIGETWTYRSGPRYQPDDGPYREDEGERLHKQLTQLHEAVDAVDSVLLDLVVHASGEYEAVTSESLKDLNPGYLYVLDPDDLPVEPGELQSGPAHAVPAGDPSEAVELLHRYVAHVERILDRQPGELFGKLPEPVQAETVDLPPDLVALYSVIDGDGGAGIFDNHVWFGLESVAEPFLERWWSARDWATEVSNPPQLDCVPALAVRRARDWPAWIPFAGDTFGNFLAVDLDPGPHGSPGQVVRIGKDHQTGPVYVADSVTTLLRLHVEALDRGDYSESNGVVTVHWNATDDDRSLLEVNGQAAPLQGVHDGIQDLRVKNAFQVDLEPVRGLPVLWYVALTNCATADLAPLQDTPIDELFVGLDQIDLSRLSGHPTVRRLTIQTRLPMDLSPLRALPALQSLDLSKAVAQDYKVLDELTDLKYLGLRADQWQQTTAPPNLAAAGLLGTPTFAEATDWAARFSPGDPARHDGTY